MQMMDVWIVKFHREVGESLKNYIGAVHMTYFGLFLFIHLFFIYFSYDAFNENMRFGSVRTENLRMNSKNPEPLK